MRKIEKTNYSLRNIGDNLSQLIVLHPETRDTIKDLIYNNNLAYEDEPFHYTEFNTSIFFLTSMRPLLQQMIEEYNKECDG